MSLIFNQEIPVSGLKLAVDATNPLSFIEARSNKSLINTDSWTINSGGAVTGYGVNETTSSENYRYQQTDPWGNASIVWETRASGDGNGDGGWNTSNFNVDRSKLYRFSVWVRRTSSTTGGTFYFGMYGNTGILQNDDNTDEGNPYWDCISPSVFTQNEWYLVCGHVYPTGTTYTGRHPNSGYYTRSTGGSVKVRELGGCNIGSGDLKWKTDTTSAVHRVYHYYCGDNTTRLQFAYPRVDLVDGTEPSIDDLLNSLPASRWVDISGNNNHINFVNRPPTWVNSNGGLLRFDGSTQYGFTDSGRLNLAPSTNTVIIGARYSGGTRGRVVASRSNNWLLGYHAGGQGQCYYAEGTIIFTGPGDTNWRIHAGTGNPATDVWTLWENGTSIASNSGGSAGPNGITVGGWGGSELSTCDISFVYVWDRVLTNDEITRFYTVVRQRLGL